MRKGGYEALAEKLGTEAWRPDFGPNAWNERSARSGAISVGARGLLVAFNVNLSTRQKRIAEFDRAQVSIKLVDTAVTKPHQAFEACRASARDRGVRVTGSELVGLIPEDDLIAAGKHYLKQAGQSAGIPRRMIVETAVQSLGLRELGAFDPAERVLEYRAGLVDGPLVSLTGRQFVDELSTDSPVPGGGSVAALCVAQASALVAMVANLTVGKRGYEGVQERVVAIAEEAQEVKDALLDAMDQDTAAFDRVMVAFGLPKATAEQRGARDRSIAEGAYYDVLVNLTALAELDASAEPDFAAQAWQRAAELMGACEERALAAKRAIRGRLEAAL